MGRNFRTFQVFLTLLTMGVLVIVMGYLIWRCFDRDMTRYPYLTVISAIGLITFVLGTVVVFAQLELTDKTQALGLPEGSIRSIVALIFLTMFMVIPLNLYDGFPKEIQRIEHVRISGVNDFKQGPLKGQLLAASEEPKTNPKAEQLFTLTYLADNIAKTNFANQFLTAVITLVSAVSSFFFGAAVAKGAQSSGPTPLPSLSGIAPPSGKPDADFPAVISGSDLNGVSGVRIESGSHSVLATGVTSSSGWVRCRIHLPSDLPEGQYDVIVMDTTGRSAKLSNAFSVTVPDEIESRRDADTPVTAPRTAASKASDESDADSEEEEEPGADSVF